MLLLLLLFTTQLLPAAPASSPFLLPPSPFSFSCSPKGLIKYHVSKVWFESMTFLERASHYSLVLEPVRKLMKKYPQKSTLGISEYYSHNNDASGSLLLVCNASCRRSLGHLAQHFSVATWDYSHCVDKEGGRQSGCSKHSLCSASLMLLPVMKRRSPTSTVGAVTAGHAWLGWDARQLTSGGEQETSLAE